MGKAEELHKSNGNVRASIGAGAGGPSRLTPKRAASRREEGATRSLDLFKIRLDQIMPDPDQPRKEFEPEAISRMARSLQRRGQLQPIRCRWSEAAEKWVIISGERRYRGAVEAGLAELVVWEAKQSDSAETLVDQVVENLLREDLAPVEEANAFRNLMDRHGWSTRDLADELNISQGLVVQRLALPGLPDSIQEQVTYGELSPTAAYELSKVKDPEAQARLAERAAGEEMTRDEVREAVKETVGRERAAGPARAPRRASAGPVKAWKDKVEGFSVHVERKRGWDWSGAVAALRSAAARIEAEHLAGAARD